MGLDRLKFGVMYRVGFTPWDGHALPARLTELVEGSAALPPGNALDLGCGTGDISVYLAQHGWEVTAVDFVQRALDRARAKAAAANVEVRFLQADVTRLGEYAVGTGFRLMFDGGCLHGLGDPARDAYMREVSRAVAPGARLILCAFSPGEMRSVRGISRPEIERRFSPDWELFSGGVDSGMSTDPRYDPEHPILAYDLRSR